MNGHQKENTNSYSCIRDPLSNVVLPLNFVFHSFVMVLLLLAAEDSIQITISMDFVMLPDMAS